MFLEFYGLNDQPFGVTPDPRFLYMGPAQQEAFSSLVYGIETGRGFMALIASPGLGKTTILLQLMERLRESARTALLFHTHTNPRGFLRSLLMDLGVDTAGQDMGDMQRRLSDLLIQETDAGKRIVVAIDEAQNLETNILEMVRMLSNFETPQAKLLQIVLVGQPQLADILASPQMEQFRQRISIITHFPPLGGADVPKYIDHRLRVAGYSGGRLFSPAALRLIVAASKGIPRNINNLCFQAMSIGFAKNQTKIDELTMREVIEDLNLETLGLAPAATTEASHRKPGPNPAGKRFDTPLDGGDDLAVIASTPPGRAEAVLDAVDLSSKAQGAGRTGASGSGRPGDKLPPPYATKHSAQPIALLGLLVLLTWLCSGGRLQSDLGYLGQATGVSGLFPNQNQLTSTEVASRPSAVPPVSTSQGAKTPVTETASNVPPAIPVAGPIAAEPAAPSRPIAQNEPAPRAGRLGRPGQPTRHESLGREGVAVSDRGYEPGKGRLVVESSDPGAPITINGEGNPLWVTPRIFSLTAGTYIVSVSQPGRDTWTRRVHVNEGREKWIAANPPARQPDGGMFTVDTEPPGMQVFIDGKAFGPSRVEAILRPGWHNCEVIPGPGLQALVDRFHLSPGESVTRHIRMSVPALTRPNGTRRQENGDEALRRIPEGGNP